MSTEIIRVGIVGCGRIATTRHIPELMELPQAEIVALFDQNTQRAHDIAVSIGNPDVYHSAEALLSSDGVDAVLICTPNSMHAYMSELALKNGKHVLVEKPMAVTMEDCVQMVQASKRYDRRLLVGHNQRIHPVFKRAKEIINSGKIGSILQFSSQFQHGGPEGWSIDGAGGWFLKKQEAGLGVIGDLGVHRIDLIRWMLNDEVEDISSFVASHRNIPGIEDNAALLIRCAQGAIGTIQVGWNNPMQDHRTVFYGDRGTLTFGESFDELEVQYFNEELVKEKVSFVTRADGYTEAGVAKEFITAILEKRESCLDASTIIKSMETLFRLEL